MKKILFSAMLALATFASVYADDTEDHGGDYDAQYIITDCGTVHEIPANSTDDEACDWLDYWSDKDCN